MSISDERLDSLLDQALARPPEQRAAFALDACPDDPALLERLRYLLTLAEHDRGFLDRSPLIHEADTGGHAAACNDSGRVIGAYRLVERLGSGGMGEVWLADRVEGGFRQQVAIKLMRSDTRADPDRFDAERDILAGLEHSGIARLYDGGIDGGGQPYMVMEYVQGSDLIRHCQRKSAGLDERLDLFLAVCDAVAYAHAQLVIHRDLKPANILVSDNGQVKVIDFGIARLVPGEGIGDTTATSHLSPAYASPEQLTGRRVGTATDVYALGIVLHELLTDRMLWQIDDLPLGIAVQRLLDTDPQPPSRLASETGPVSARSLRCDLDAIVAKALRPDPAHRYPDARALAEDIRRFRTHQPVHARQGARLYVASRFLRRNWLPIATVSAIFLALIAGLIGITWQARQAAIERDIAQRQSARAEAVLTYLSLMFRSAIEYRDPEATGAPTAKSVLDRSASRLLAEYRQQPQIAGQVALTLADLYAALQDHEGAVPLLEGLLDQARLDDDPALLAQAQLRLATVQRLRGHDQLAGELLAEAQAFWASAPEAYREERIQALMERGQLQRRLLDVEGSVATLRQALDQSIKLLGREHIQVARLYDTLAYSLITANRPDEAVEAYHHALTIFTTIKDGASVEGYVITGNAGILAYRTGRINDAATWLSASIAGQRRLAGDSAAVAAMMAAYGVVLTNLGQHDDAVVHLREALALGQRFAGTASPLVMQNRRLLGDALIARGDFAEARTLLTEALDDVRERLGEKHQFMLWTRLARARLDATEGHQRQALEEIQAIVAGFRDLGPGAATFLPEALTTMAELRLALKQPAAAIDILREIAVIRERTHTRESWELAYTRALLGEALLAGTDTGEGRALLEQAAPVLIAQLGQDHPKTQRALRFASP